MQKRFDTGVNLYPFHQPGFSCIEEFLVHY